MKKTLLALPLVFVFGCTLSTLGTECKTAGDCEAGESCQSLYGQNFCGKGCFLEGTASDCPNGSACIYLGQDKLQCQPTCKTGGDCRTGFECAPAGDSGTYACRPQAQ